MSRAPAPRTGSRALRAVGVLAALTLLFDASPARPAVDVVSPGRFPIEVDGSTLEIPFESSHPLDVPDASIERVVVVVHGSSRNSDDYFARVRAAAEAAGEARRTLVLAPQFLEEEDIDAWALPPNVPFWSKRWRKGNRSRSTAAHPRPARISSYAVVDAMLEAVSDATLFPNLAFVVVTGHSAGGQFVQRFAAGSPAELAHPELSFRYVVANPSSYLYFTPERRVPGAPGAFAVPPAAEIAACPDYDDYKYGLRDLNLYMGASGAALLSEQYPAREVQYLIGALDTGSSGLDTACPAMLQGESRLERGRVFFDHVRQVFGPEVLGRHALRIVPGVGHSSARIYTSAIGRDALFGASLGDPRVPALGAAGRALLAAALVAVALGRGRVRWSTRTGGS